jgi:aspartate aminotransferase
MTGWRIGWTLSPANVAKAMADLQSQETSNPCSISQYAALAALEGPQQCVDEMLREFTRRREFVRRRIAEIPGVSCPEMAGAFYAFMNIQEHLGKTYNGQPCNTSAEWCLALLEQQNVATVMGSAFGAEGYARLSFATALETLDAGLARIEAFIRSAK